MPTEVILPRVDMDMTEGTITAWYVKDGDTVKQGEPLFDIETSKATMEIESPASGVVRKITAAVADTVPVGTVIAWIYASAEAVAELEEVVVGATAEEPLTSPAGSSTAFEPVLRRRGQDEEPAHAALGGLRATPAARRAARESRIRLEDVGGSGPLGRIVEKDVRAFLQREGANAALSKSLHRIWLQTGNAVTIVLIHGFGAESNSWRPLFNAMGAASLLTDRGVLAIDLPGHGKSPDDAADSLTSIREAVETVLEEEQVGELHLVAHSFGGAVAIELASRLHSRVRSVTLLSPAGLGESCNWAFINGLVKAIDPAALRAWLEELVENRALIDDAFVATALQQLRRDGRREALQRIAATFFRDGRLQFDLRAAILDLPMPVRAIWGGDDRILPIAHADRLPGVVAQHRFSGVGHLPQVEVAKEVAKIVGEQLLN